MRTLESLFLTPSNMVLATDLYQLTMMAAYLEWEMEEPATFELFVRRLPKHRGFLVAAGLEQCLHYLEELRFDGESIDFLRKHEVFSKVSPRFFERLRAYRFGGDVWALAEGTPFFSNEPIIRIRAPLFEAQLVETYLLAAINYQTSVASKAARVALSAKGRACVDFGTRRAHGPQAGVLAARAAYLAGIAGTSNLLAGKLCGIPVVGTAAHAFTMACPNEEEAFRRYHKTFPDHTTLLIDTYDTHRGALRATKISGKLKGVRLDSGDLAQLAKEVRVILDQEGREDARIVASGDLNEDKIAALLEKEAPIDLFGVGTEMVTSKDHPALGGVYKLVSKQSDGQEIPTMKLSEGKMTYPGAKQVWRLWSKGQAQKDLLTLENAARPTPDATPLIHQVMSAGKRSAPTPSLSEIRAYALTELGKLPEALTRRSDFPSYQVEIGEDVLRVVDSLRADLE